ncbi:MAG TPA: hypothetical protein VMJ75_18885 [Candidatus Acidoferrales bacterium]|nr:hypothetical protein [Candidatus Acidoferrales bacterium]
MRRRVVVCPIMSAIFIHLLCAQVDVLTQHGNNARTGANLNEKQLTVAHVNNNEFGKLAYRIVDGNIYAQPLIVTNAKDPSGAAKTMAVVATENNSVYSFNAEDTNQASTTAQIWQRNLGPSIDYQTMYSDIGKPDCTDITLQIGITGTPAIALTGGSPRTGVVWVTAKTKPGSQYAYTLHALDLATGNLVSSTPIQGQVNGQGLGSTGTGASATIAFNPKYQLNRPGLLLSGNLLYIAFGGHCDAGPYHGWVFAYDVSNPKAPKNVGVFCTTLNGKGPLDPQRRVYIEGMGGIWMSGQGPATDDNGNVFLTTGNGTYNGTTDYGDSVVKLKVGGGGLRILDWFTPANQDLLKDKDYDLGSGGIALVPNSHLAVTGGKEGRMYLLDQANLGKGTKPSLHSFQVTPDPVPANFVGYNIHGAPVIWPRNGEMFVYVMGEEDRLKQFRLIPDTAPGGAGWKFESDAPFKMSQEVAPYPGYPNPPVYSPTRADSTWMPGGFLTLSANGATDGTGIVWVNMPFEANANPRVVRGVLRAFDATDVSKGEIWDSQGTGRNNDSLGQFAKFCPPTVANGKVYVATFQQETVLPTGTHIKANIGDQPALVIYGLLGAGH